MASSSIPSNLQSQQILEYCNRLYKESQEAEANFARIKEDVNHYRLKPVASNMLAKQIEA